MTLGTMETALTHMLGGSLRPGDPRRYLIEAMIGAMHVDGRVDPREIEVLQKHLGGHALFAGLPPDTARVLIELARDALQLAWDGRIAGIARGLPTRTYRLAAFSMACEMCAADGQIHMNEVGYMMALQQGLCIGLGEAGALFEGARQGRAMDALEQAIARLGELVPRMVDCFALQHCMERRVLKRHQKRLFDFLVGLADVRVQGAQIQREIDRAFDPLSLPRDVPRALERLAAAVSDPADRYWIAVYVAAGQGSRGHADAAEPRFLELVSRVFGLDTAAVAQHAVRLVVRRDGPDAP